MKKVLIQNNEQLELVKEEIRVSSLFTHPNLLPLLDHAIIAVKASQNQSWKHEAYLLFPVHLDGTLLDNAIAMKAKKEFFFSTSDVLQIFHQLCAGLKHMHSSNPPYAHNDVKPGYWYGKVQDLPNLYLDGIYEGDMLKFKAGEAGAHYIREGPTTVLDKLYKLWVALYLSKLQISKKRLKCYIAA